MDRVLRYGHYGLARGNILFGPDLHGAKVRVQSFPAGSAVDHEVVAVGGGTICASHYSVARSDHFKRTAAWRGVQSRVDEARAACRAKVVDDRAFGPQGRDQPRRIG
jgi:hypothetical protein